MLGTLRIISLNPQNNATGRILLTLTYGGEIWGSEKLSNLFQITQLVVSRARIWGQFCPHFSPTTVTFQAHWHGDDLPCFFCTLVLSKTHVKWKWKKVKVTQLCPTLCDCMNYTVHGILQARILEWVAIPFSRDVRWNLFRYVMCINFINMKKESYTLLFSCSVVSNSSWPHGLQHARLLCLPLSPGICSNSCPLSWWCYLIISSSATSFSSCPQSFPASGSFPISWFFASGGQSIGALASASVLPVNTQCWCPLGLTDLIFLQSKGLTGVFSTTTIQKHQFFSIQPSFWSSSHIYTWLLGKP